MLKEILEKSYLAVRIYLDTSGFGLSSTGIPLIQVKKLFYLKMPPEERRRVFLLNSKLILNDVLQVQKWT